MFWGTAAKAVGIVGFGEPMAHMVEFRSALRGRTDRERTARVRPRAARRAYLSSVRRERHAEPTPKRDGARRPAKRDRLGCRMSLRALAGPHTPTATARGEGGGQARETRGIGTIPISARAEPNVGDPRLQVDTTVRMGLGYDAAACRVPHRVEREHIVQGQGSFSKAQADR